jgi:aspartate beta-hydroxylase
MSMNADQILESSLKAINGVDAAGARRSLESWLATNDGSASHFLALAVACRMTGDDRRGEAVLDKVLAMDPRNVNALIMKGDLLAARNDLPAAAGFYSYIIRLAVQTTDNPEMQRMADHARKSLDKVNAVLYGHLDSHLQKSGYEADKAPVRFRHALDLLTGRKQVYQPRPRAFYYPELPPRQFFGRDEFGWLAALEAATPDIAEELVEAMTQQQDFVPYLQGDARVAGNDANKVSANQGWKAFFLWKDGKPVEEHIRRCPRTMAALQDVPLFTVPERGPNILFSVLHPGAKIAPHTGFINTRLICHLPLLVPPDCGFRVGNDTRPWVPGKAFLFDDTIEHEAWNNSDQTRVVLLFDIWRPELTEQERHLITSLLEGVDSYTPGKKHWNV